MSWSISLQSQFIYQKRELLGQLVPTDGEDNNIIPETIYADICHVYEDTDRNKEEIRSRKEI